MDKFNSNIKISELTEGARNLNIRAIVLDIKLSKRSHTNEDIFLLRIADETAQINCTLFDERVALLKPSDIIYMTNCYTKMFQSQLKLYKYIEGEIIKVDDFCMVFNEMLDMSRKNEEKCQDLAVINEYNELSKSSKFSRKYSYPSPALSYFTQNPMRRKYLAFLKRASDRRKAIILEMRKKRMDLS